MSVPLRDLYLAREEFLTESRTCEELVGRVRPEVLASWRRSQLSGAKADAPTLNHQDDTVADSPLCRAAEPVLARLAERFTGLRAGVLLADRDARILRRWVAPDSGILPQMDRIFSIAGSSGSEQYIGTNGIGTVAEDRRARMVVGPEHFAEALSGFTCVGAPIHNPLTHKLEGVVTLNSDVDSASPLLTPLMTSTAQEIEHRLLDQVSMRERMLLDTFLTANRSGGSVAVVGEDVFMAGPRAARLLEGVDHALIWQCVSEAVAAHRSSRAIFLPTGPRVVALRCSPLMADGRLAGALIEVDEGKDLAGPPTTGPLTKPTSRRVGQGRLAAQSRVSPHSDWPEGPELLPGQSAAWENVLRTAAANRASSLPLVVSGEPGTGKLSLLRAMYAGTDRVLHAFDCMAAADDRSAWLSRVRAAATTDSGSVVVLRHLEVLDERSATALSALVDEVADHEAPPRLVATLATAEWPAEGAVRRLLDQLAVARIELPALRQRREDVKDLIAHFVALHAAPGALRISQGALVALNRAPWPGNVRELESVVRGLIAVPGHGEVTVEMLPSGLGQYSSRRELTTMEQVELDAIISAIKRAQGNKVLAAKQLGISRSTLYRKMRTYKLDPDKHFF